MTINRRRFRDQQSNRVQASGLGVTTPEVLALAALALARCLADTGGTIAQANAGVGSTSLPILAGPGVTTPDAKAVSTGS